MKVNVTGGEISAKEMNAYVDRGTEKYGDALEQMDILVDGDSVEIKYYLNNPAPFERIRRITGYLVGTLDRFNNAKRAEESDRVKHV